MCTCKQCVPGLSSGEGGEGEGPGDEANCAHAHSIIWHFISTLCIIYNIVEVEKHVG